MCPLIWVLQLFTLIANSIYFFLIRRNSPPPLICFGLLAIFLLVLFCSVCCYCWLWMRCGVFVFLVVIMIVFCLISTIWLDANWPRFYHKFSAVCDIVVFSQFSLLLVTSSCAFIFCVLFFCRRCRRCCSRLSILFVAGRAKRLISVARFMGVYSEN